MFFFGIYFLKEFWVIYLSIETVVLSCTFNLGDGYYFIKLSSHLKLCFANRIIILNRGSDTK